MTKTEHMKKSASTNSLKLGAGSSTNNASTFSGVSLFQQLGFGGTAPEQKRTKEAKKAAIQKRWAQYKDTSNPFFEVSSSDENSSDKRSSRGSKKSGGDRRKSFDSGQVRVGFELSDQQNLSKSMSNDIKLPGRVDLQPEAPDGNQQFKAGKCKKELNAFRQKILKDLCDSSSESDSNDNLSDDYEEIANMKHKKDDRKKKTEEQICKERQKVHLIKIW